MHLSLRLIVTVLGTLLVLGGATSSLALRAQSETPDHPALSDGQRLFYSGRYQAAADVALALISAETEVLAAYELRTAALHFQIKRALGDAANKSQALARCAECPALMSAFFSDTAAGQTLARARLLADPQDEPAMFLLGKLDLNYVWLQLGTLGRKTGWEEYWEARRSLDAVLKRNPVHVRARVARAWIDYIVDTKLPRGTKWLLGGGNRKRALRAMREAAATEADVFVQAEAGFALWEMLVRERAIADAVVIAQDLARDFPDNQDLITFLAARDSWSAR